MPTERDQWFKTFLEYLKSEGWEAVFEPHGWDLSLDGVQRALPVDRTQPGFEDFSSEGNQAVTPGDPACGLLYHGLMSPGVVPDLPDSAWPDLEQIDRLENYIYGLTPVSVEEAKRLTPVVMAYEYRPAGGAPHGCHADLCFSRTGVGRVGARSHAWDPRRRCFHSEDPDQPGKNRVLAVRYGVFLCESADLDGGGLSLRGNRHPKDGKRRFWLPRQKLFEGEGAIEGVHLDLWFRHRHVNDKLQRMITKGGLKLTDRNFDLQHPPFHYDSDWHDFIDARPLEGGVVLARHPQELVRAAKQRDRLIGFNVPPEKKRCPRWLPKALCRRLNGRRYTSLWVGRRLGFILADIIVRRTLGLLGSKLRPFLSPRHNGEYTNIRHRLCEDGTVEDLNTRVQGFESLLEEGNYPAVMFEDPICEGVVHAEIQGFDGLQAAKPAYSLFTAPDFMPRVDGIDLYGYDSLFTEGGVRALCEGRLPPNLRLRMPGCDAKAFRKEEETAVALVSRSPRGDQKPAVLREYERSRYLTDAASDVFAPGWDITYDKDHLLGPPYYHTAGLGSPFHEDAKLCAAANGMWPAASPDAARTFRRDTRTAIPLTDEELGLAPGCGLALRNAAVVGFGWDGEYGPYLEQRDGVCGINFPAIERADYISNGLAGRMSFAALRRLSREEIRHRMDALAQCRAHQGEETAKVAWLFLFQGLERWDYQAVNLPDECELLIRLVNSFDRQADAGYLLGFAMYEEDQAIAIPKTPDRIFQPCVSFHFYQVPIGKPPVSIPIT